MKKFYQQAAIVSSDGLWQVTLDGRPVKTPARADLSLPCEKLAQAVAAEWQAQTDTIKPGTMPLTQIATTAIDRAGPARPEITAQCMGYLDSDLVCYRAAKPDVAAAQEAAWGTALAWFTGQYGPLETTTALSPLTQPEATTRAVRAVVEALDLYHFTVLQIVCAATGSLVLALAFNARVLDARAVYEAALCEELFFERTLDLARYGPDPSAGPKQAALHAELDACRTLLDMIA